MAGGRTNPIWRIGSGPGALVCKLFRPGSATPLFANDPKAEVLALTALRGTNLAPRLVAAMETEAGESLIYAYVDGTPWRSGVEQVGQLLRRLHATPPPDGLPRSETGGDRLLVQGEALLAQVGAGSHALLPPRPEPVAVTVPRRVFLHGDVVPGNLMSGSDGLTLIDWQCPAVGDACDDLAVFLSPAMQHAYGNAPLSRAHETAFLDAYDDPETVRRYHALRPAYHWRMAAYALWRAARSEPDYAMGAKLEIARLKQG